MPNAAYFHRRAKACRSLAEIDNELSESLRYAALAIDCTAKAHELDIDELQSKMMPSAADWYPGERAEEKEKKNKIALPGGFVRLHHIKRNAQVKERS
jgi:hypothetical protein